MKIYYTARESFEKKSDPKGWEFYQKGSRLKHCTEIVSVDSLLNNYLVEADLNDGKTYDYLLYSERNDTGLYYDLQFVLQNVYVEHPYNLMACVVNPDQDCSKFNIENFEFVGYDLLDKSYDISALTNCGGFPETFLLSDQNQYGLIDDFEKAFDIKKRLLENNPHEFHADCNVIALWRHKTIGRIN